MWVYQERLGQVIIYLLQNLLLMNTGAQKIEGCSPVLFISNRPFNNVTHTEIHIKVKKK